MNDDIIAIDFDGTLVYFNEYQGSTTFGFPIYTMIDRVKKMIEENKNVVIFTARITDAPEAIEAIEKWCEKYLGKKLEVTNVKHWKFKEIWDDRAIQIITNTGMRSDGKE